MRARPTFLSLGLALQLFSACWALASPPELTDDQIRSILQNWVEREHWGVGIVVGLIDENGSRIVSYGKMQNDDQAAAVNGDTLFEIGSVTKTFTTLLLADQIQRGEMHLDDPLEKHLPAFVTSGDPAWGVSKRLSVRYRSGDKIATVRTTASSDRCELAGFLRRSLPVQDAAPGHVAHSFCRGSPRGSISELRVHGMDSFRSQPIP